MFNDNCDPIMKRKNGEIVATGELPGEADKVYVLDDELTIKQQFNGYDRQPYSIDFDNKYILIGYSGYSGMVHLHNRSNGDRKEVIITF